MCLGHKPDVPNADPAAERLALAKENAEKLNAETRADALRRRASAGLLSEELDYGADNVMKGAKTSSGAGAGKNVLRQGR